VKAGHVYTLKGYADPSEDPVVVCLAALEDRIYCLEHGHDWRVQPLVPGTPAVRDCVRCHRAERALPEGGWKVQP
jgi:hypothetical protein